MHTIAIIGGGFAGTMTAVHLMHQADMPLRILIINTHFPLIKGIAYATQYPGHLLNVTVDSISAFDQQEDHFFNWLQQHHDFKDLPAENLKTSFAPRKVYAEYLDSIWEAAVAGKSSLVNLQIIEDEVVNVHSQVQGLTLGLKANASVNADYVVLATGNAIPKNPPIADAAFYSSPLYFKNPWNDEGLQNLKSERDILLIGNSLTMIDAVISLLANGFTKNIYTVSPHGFAIMPDEHVPPYDRDILNEIARPYRLYDLITVISKHMKRCKQEGISRLAVINSIRHNLQEIWVDFTIQDKRRFLKRISPMWNAWRHRTPAGMYQKISGLRDTGKLTTITGRLISFTEKDGYAEARIFDKTTNREIVLDVERVINCTGSQIDVRLPGTLLNNMYTAGLINPDPLNIALNADAQSGAVINRDGNTSTTIYTLGNNMKGILWETTGVPEIRAQAENIAMGLIKQVKQQEVSIEKTSY
ncbi:FAD/NAD(P)-binding protein [Mucilaginibacter polytrichastri]|uniref:FAD-dependent urate hydroxylase HpyO/Asp monooxygenase CreE-like FAD/NAD(P)-binding domain-containing protein n=1 Tax=Mucilaginibacter polytrichastri TaxID=1302689 RepID=A0A1Q5ZSA5_9SPHI|nr:FAD/NAD(P)-binding protein [Mucilaginibacter polytrichastri]OKS84649.1 hypothetical protein RG47T_0081 [Mucilaginibacter polytrichastri]SFT01979.1 Uncharacterized NAD(P)/FAD-binding protein YdhS [Mucilaginibacter polytrichastri]